MHRQELDKHLLFAILKFEYDWNRPCHQTEGDLDILICEYGVDADTQQSVFYEHVEVAKSSRLVLWGYEPDVHRIFDCGKRLSSFPEEVLVYDCSDVGVEHFFIIAIDQGTFKQSTNG